MTNSLGLAREVLEQARVKRLWIATAESITAGGISAQLADVAGASQALLGGLVTYQDSVKAQLLAVPAEVLRTDTAVSAAVAELMAASARSKLASAAGHLEAQVVAISSTGYAGPESAEGVPAGTVFVAVSSALGTRHVGLKFSGQRNRVRDLTVRAALRVLREELHKL